jgi:hypothetical protein
MAGIRQGIMQCSTHSLNSTELVSHGTTAVTGKTLMIEAARASETSSYQTIRRHIQKDSSLQLEYGEFPHITKNISS